MVKKTEAKEDLKKVGTEGTGRQDVDTQKEGDKT